MAVIKFNVLSANIKEVEELGLSMRGRVQEVLVACAFYIMKDGNTTPANDLLKACTKARVERTALTTWLELFSPCYVKEDKLVLSRERAKEFHVETEADFKEYEVEMRKLKWWDATKPKPAQSIFDANKAIHSMETLAKKMEKAGLNMDSIELLRKAMGTLVQDVANEAFEEMAA